MGSGAASFGGLLISEWNLDDAVQRTDTMDGLQARVDGLFSAAGVAPLVPEIFDGAAAFLPAATVLGVGSGSYSITQLADQVFGMVTGQSLTDRIAGVDNRAHFPLEYRGFPLLEREMGAEALDSDLFRCFGDHGPDRPVTQILPHLAALRDGPQQRSPRSSGLRITLASSPAAQTPW